MKKIFLILFVFVSCSLFSQNVREGSTRYGTILYNYDGKNLRQGSTRYGTILFNVDGIIPKGILMLLCM